MRRLIQCLAAALLTAAPLYAKVNIPTAMWQANINPGYCGWVSCKTLMLRHGWDDVAAVVIEDERRLGGGRHGTINGRPAVLPAGGTDPQKLEERFKSYEKRFGLKWKQLRPVNLRSGEKVSRESADAVVDAVKKGYGCVVDVDNGRHAVTLVDVTEKKYKFTYPDGIGVRYEQCIEYIDNNHVKAYKDGFKKELTTTKTSFQWWRDNDWSGWAVIIYPKDDKPAEEEVDEPRQSVPNMLPPAEGELSPLIAPRPPPPQIKPPAPAFPAAQPQPHIVVPADRPKPPPVMPPADD